MYIDVVNAWDHVDGINDGMVHPDLNAHSIFGHAHCKQLCTTITEIIQNCSVATNNQEILLWWTLHVMIATTSFQNLNLGCWWACRCATINSKHSTDYIDLTHLDTMGREHVFELEANYSKTMCGNHHNQLPERAF